MQEHEPVLAGATNGRHTQPTRAPVNNFPSRNGKHTANSRTPERGLADLLASVTAFCDELAGRPNTGETAAPLAELRRAADLALLTAPLPRVWGGLGLGTESATHITLLRVLAAMGGADLGLSRLYEGHVNALVLLNAFGTPAQLARAARDAEAGMLFAVWNTGEREPIRLSGGPDFYAMAGAKTFASGADFVRRPVVTGERVGGGWQMTLPRMEAPDVADALRIDRSFWHPLGMESSESYRVDFTGAVLQADDLLGQPGDFYRDPLFRGGAIRFAAVHAGAIIRLHRMFAEWLDTNNRGGDPYQVARLGEVALAAQSAALWIERAAEVAENCLHRDAGKIATERMVECANMTRVVIERLATETMQRVTAGIGAHGLLRPQRFERILRDLTTYLRQPAPDHTLAEVGRASLRKIWVKTNGPSEGLWGGDKMSGTLPPSYFQRVYQHSADPWDFQTSDYEAAKYADTLDTLPAGRFHNVLEIGCSIGVLTRKLAEHCDALLGLDVSEKALDAARERCGSLAQVQFRCMEFPREVPDGFFDLIVVSEVAYYWEREDLERAATELADHQQPGGHLLLVHLTELVPDYPLTGDQVHNAWLCRPEWKLVSGHRKERYRVDLLQRVAL